MKLIVITAAALALAAASPAFAQSTSAKSPSSMTTKFVTDAAMTDMTEIQEGRLAQDEAATPAYKDFGKMLVDDHTKSSQKLKTAASKSGATVPADLDAAHKKKVSEMQALSGAKFENKFKSEQVSGHQKAIKMYEDYAQKGDNADLKKFAQETLPTLNTHLQHAQALPKGASAPTTGSSK
jgi:putative membrane protein